MPELPLPELLAPAGNPSVALSAFDAGADAVYCGLPKFNARERSENFSHEELAKLIGYARRNHRKVYVTFNTLLKESELDEAAREMAFLAECRPDAVIVQDLGAARMFREFFPQLVLHASTQLGIHNSAGLEMARRFRFRRVILERQVTLDELRKMIPDGKPPVEMELFIHGALCCCVSGSCLFSSWLGGWSGNRGKCKQPCRRRYFTGDPSDGGGSLFSPDDLCSLELLDDFRRLGICSLKIEGRLRRADYVEKVVRAYRLALDAAPDCRAEALKEAGRILAGAVTRKTSLGFYSAESMRKLIRPDSAGASGILCGTVEKTVPGGFEARMTGRIHVGDTIRIQSGPDAGDGLNMTVLYLEKGRAKVMKVRAGERCFIRSDRKPDRGALIFRTGEAGSDLSARAAALPEPRIPLDVHVRLEENRPTAAVGECDARFELDLAPLAAARSHAVSGADLEKAFAAAGSERFEAGRISAETAGEWFVPAAVLKEWRKSFWAWAEQTVPPDLHRKTASAGLRRFREEVKRLGEGPRPAPLPDCTAVSDSVHPAGIRACEIGSAGPSDEIILPPFVPEGRLAELRSRIGALLAEGAGVFRLTSFFQFALFPDPGKVTLKTMYPFPVANSQAVLVCREAGASAVQAWIELGQGDWRDLLDRSVLPLEAYVSGRPCIFLTRASVPGRAGRIRDARGNRFELERKDGMCGLYPAETLDIEKPDGYSAFRDERKKDGGSGETTDFNFSRGWA
ncbi:MAG: U32 family peptidase [Lentisphaeria bacterium]|nr:U32 family peptidase [Lentisphaeria bacterium]